MPGLNRYGYSITNSSRQRHAALAKAIRSIGYKKVYRALTRRIRSETGYREDRARADRNWVRDRAQKRGHTVT